MAAFDELGNLETYTYNADGRLISRTDALGNTTTFSDDANTVSFVGNDLGPDGKPLAHPWISWRADDLTAGAEALTGYSAGDSVSYSGWGSLATPDSGPVVTTFTYAAFDRPATPSSL